MSSNTRSLTADEVVGALLALTGLVAFLVKSNLLHIQLNFPVPAPVANGWPVALIAGGIALLWWQRRRSREHSERPMGNGERE